MVRSHWAKRILVQGSVMLLATGAWGTTAGAAPSSPEKVVFASPAAGSAVGLLSDVIKKDHLDEQNGVALDIKYFDPAATEQAVVLRRADVGIFPVISAARVNLAGHRIRLFAPALINHNSVVLQKGTTASRLADLKGKRIGTLDRISMTYTTLATLAKMQGLDLDHDFKLTLSPPPVLMGLFGRGELDALVIFEPLVTSLVGDGHREMVRLDDLWRKETGQPMVALAIGAHEDWLKAHPEAVRGVFRTVTEAIATIQKNPNRVVDEHRSSLMVKTDEQAARLAARMPQLYPTKWDRALIDNMELLLRKNVELGLLERMPRDEIFVVVQ
jgi:ABC-type nitrate/sulfonate/bicarbonate transport system substrate-binding protein